MAVKEKRGLGTGLEALFASGGSVESPEEISLLPISRVEPRADQPRNKFDEERLQDLAESGERDGKIQPIIVRALPNGDYQIIAGERRWRAARIAGLDEVPVRVIDADDRRVAELALVENLQREDLNPMEEARGYQKLMQDYSLTQEQAAEGVGKSRSAVANSLRLLHLSKAVAQLVEDGSLSAGHARALLQIDDPVLQEKAAGMVLSRTLSVRKTEELAAKLRDQAEKAEVPEKLSSDGVDYAAALADELSLLYGRKIALREKNSRGKIELYYDNADDRENLIAALRKLQ